MNRFIVAGLPRSATAWASVLLSRCTGVFCWHDGVQHGDCFRCYRELFEAPEAEITGDSTTSLLPRFDSIDATRVWIERDEEECLESYIKEIGDQAKEAWPTILQQAAEWRATHNPRAVIYDKLFSDDDDISFLECRRLVLYCTGHNLLSKLDWLVIRQLHISIHGLSPTYYDNRKIILDVHAPHDFSTI